MGLLSSRSEVAAAGHSASKVVHISVGAWVASAIRFGATLAGMAANNDQHGLALGLGGGAAVAVGSSMTRRQGFREQLATEMRERWLGQLVNCELGRNQDGTFWLLTIHHPTKGVHPVVVRLGDCDPYSPEALTFVLDRVSRWALQTP